MKVPFYLLVTMAFASCVSHQESSDNGIILPGEDRNDTEFYDAVKSVEVIDFEIDSNFVHTDECELLVSDNYYYFVKFGIPQFGRKSRLACYDKATGKMMFSRTMDGRSRAECTRILNWFVKGDNIVLNDGGLLKMYNHTGKFLGTLNDTALWVNLLLPLGDGYIACNFDGSVYSDDKGLTLFDSNFNAGESFFVIPESYRPFANSSVSNSSPNTYIFNDTLRFCVQNSFNLHSFPGDKIYRFIPSNPLPESMKTKQQIADINFIITCLEKGYATSISGLVENQDFIMFRYQMGRKTFHVLLSKSDNKVYGFNDSNIKVYNSERIKAPFDIWKIFIGNSNILYSDGKYFYARCNRSVIDILKDYQSVFNDLQRSVYDTMQARLARTADNEFEYFYLKIEFSK